MEYYHGNRILLRIVFYIWVLEEIMRERVNEGKSEGDGGRQREGRGAANVRLCTLVLATHVTWALNVKSKRFY